MKPHPSPVTDAAPPKGEMSIAKGPWRRSGGGPRVIDHVCENRGCRQRFVSGNPCPHCQCETRAL